MSLVNVARFLVGAGVLLSCGVFVAMLNGFKLHEAVILAVWVAAPLPIAYGAGRWLAKTRRSWTAVVAGLAVAFALGAWLYWDAFLGRSSREESLAGLIVLVAPIYQLVVLALALVAAWLLSGSAR